MKKVIFLFIVFGLTIPVSLPAKLPKQKTFEQKDTAQVQLISPEEELALIDSAKVGIGGEEELPLAEGVLLYDSWNNASSDPYRLPVDSIFTKSDTIAIPIESYTYPLLTHINVNSEFGKRGRRFHNGIDLKLNRGDTVATSMAGKVRIAKYSGAFGNLVVVRHHNGLETFYGHLSKLLVKPDQMVESGEVIGLGGNTGRSTGPHLHYEVRYLGKPINPRILVDFDSTLTAKSDTLLLTAELFKHVSKQAYSSSTGSNTAALQSGQGGIWAVKSGDSLSLISKRTGTSISYLCNVNGISRNSILRLGQKIKY
jgi:hypothetical protein